MTDVIMPQLGESIAEGTIVKWLKKVGDPVRRDEDLLVVSTDKVEAELPSPAAGVLQEIRVPEGKTVPIKTVIAVIGEGAAATVTRPEPAPAPPPAAPPPPAAALAGPAPAIAAPAPAAAPAPDEGRHWYSPLVKKIAHDEGVSADELRRVPGSGRGGRVSRRDLEAYVQARKEGRTARGNGHAPPAPAPSAPAPAAPPPAPRAAPHPRAAREEARPMTNLRKIIAENMLRSRQTSAHVQTIWEVDYRNIVKVRDKYKDAFKREEGAGLTFTVFMAHAVAKVLRKHPVVNSEVRGTDIIFKKDVNLGIAVDLGEDGLIVPVVFGAQDLNLRGLARAIDDVATRARSKRLKPDEIRGGTFTITNFGVFGSLIGMPIINQPEVAILGVGAVVKRPVVIESAEGDTLGIRPMGLLSLSFDHRIVDGAAADRFMKDLVAELEDWNLEP